MRKRITFANIIATVALVFAMTGGAYAASKYLITSTKQISPKVLKALAGKKGPMGAPGPEGKTGATGTPGKEGAPGKEGIPGKEGAPGKEGVPGKEGEKGLNGSNGKSVIAAVEGKGTNCKEGGSSFEVEGSGKKTYACNGEGASGGGGYPETLPSGKTETGAWTGFFPSESEGGKGTEATTWSAISFAIPLAAGLGSTAWHYVTSAEQTAKTQPLCPGTVERPTATKGNLCVYEGGAIEPNGAGEPVKIVQVKPPSSPGSGAETGTGTSGAELLIHYEGPREETVEITGSWAVSAP